MIYTSNESKTHHVWECWRKIVVSVFGFGCAKTRFWHTKTATFGDCWCKTTGLPTSKSKSREELLSPTFSKYKNDISHLDEFCSKFENHLVKAHFRSKPPKSKPYGALAETKSLKSRNGCFGLLIHKGTGCEVGRAQKIFLVFHDTLLQLPESEVSDLMFNAVAMC